MHAKKWTAAVCAAALAVSLTACGTRTASAADDAETSLAGQVTAIDGSEVTLLLGTLEEREADAAPAGAPGQDDAVSPPEKPADGANSGAPGSAGGQPPAKPGSDSTGGGTMPDSALRHGSGGAARRLRPLRKSAGGAARRGSPVPARQQLHGGDGIRHAGLCRRGDYGKRPGRPAGGH